jgi:hypothetical protein
MLSELRLRSSSISTTFIISHLIKMYRTVPPEPSKKLPKTVGGEDQDPIVRHRREKVKEVCTYNNLIN